MVRRLQNQNKRGMNQKKESCRVHKWIGIAMMFCIIVSLIFMRKNVEAASCNVALSTEDNQVLVGDAFNVTISLEADEAISGVEMMMSYDEDALDYITGSPAISGEGGYLKISDMDMASESSSVKYVVKFEVKKAGVTYIKMNSDASVYNENSGQSMSVASNVLSVNGYAKDTASTDTSLKSLEVSPGELTPNFSNEITEYSVTVEAPDDKFIVSATPTNDKAKVDIEQPQRLSLGQNTITVIVAAENGDTKEYMIHVLYQENSQIESEQESNEEDTAKPVQEEMTSLQPISAEKTQDATTLTIYGQYTVQPLTNLSLLPYGYEETTIFIDGCSITAYQNSQEKSDFVLLYASKANAQPAIYQYDKKEQTLQRFNQLASIPDAVEMTPDTTESGIVGNHSSVYDALLIGLSILCILFMILSIIGFRRKRR